MASRSAACSAISRADHDAGAVAGPACPAQLVKISDELDDVGQAEHSGDLSRVTGGWYFGGGQGAQSLGPRPGGVTAPAGAFLFLLTGPFYREGLTFPVFCTALCTTYRPGHCLCTAGGSTVAP